jgi:hypothetical protein
MQYLRSLLGLKDHVHRDRVPAVFLTHCRAEAENLKDQFVAGFSDYCDGGSGRPALQAVLTRPWAQYRNGEFIVSDRTLLDAHCFAMATAAGLDAIYDHIDPRSQARGTAWDIHRRIVAEDVGEKNVGHAPSPRPRPGMHISYVPGSFTGGIASPQHWLVNRYQEFASATDRVVLLLLSLRVIAPRSGIGKALYAREEVEGWLVLMNRYGTIHPAPDPIDEWAEGLVVTDSKAALSELPTPMVRRLVRAVEQVDPFWPAYSQRHRLTY